MVTYDYIVAKFTPNELRGESKNVGVLLLEKDSKKVFGRFVIDEYLNELEKLSPEANVKALNVILKTFHGERSVDSENYLDELVNTCKESLKFKTVCTKDADTPQEALDDLVIDHLSLKTKPLTA